ncbi:asparagine synthase (glutamine-hydrolyzing) [Micromonospora sp. C31]|uniref:asparagine synthase (glutamine-hydrolyzing) n=1 Tax=Micromonospora sp. C31 TaxID=2824876 RepID=UPI001B377A6E|nr:asparagine synthase (glutamine-hydrolyzing) [Micromonospora sp. C31]MBQ1075629.1 asparagine synthase (glutamine-hydrolyzing) [Micromonospora sp. C31]
MCGIAGLVDFRPPMQDHTELVTSMANELAWRGPDDLGVWVHQHVGFGVRRLSVIDIHGGRQPMVEHRPDEPPVALAYTGEVFNCPELRAELGARGHRFSTTSDTEVVLRAYLEWGAACAERLLGMFAFAVWDGRTEELLLVRDRFGIYPLHYAEVDGGIVFGSELKALLAHPAVRPEVDLDGLRAIVGFVKAPDHGIFRGTKELLPGTVLRSGRNGSSLHTYWSLPAREHTDDLDTTVATVRELLEDSVRRQIVSDVPLGSFLSGGLDSSAIAALAVRAMRERGDEKLRTFSVDYAGHAETFRPDEVRSTPDYPFVELMAKYLGTEHTRVTLTTDQLMDPQVRSAVLRARDIPTSLGDLDTSLYLLSKAFRQDCTVALTGDAADELFGGYHWFLDPHYRQAESLPWLEFARRMMGKNQMRNTGLLAPDLVKTLDTERFDQDAYHTAVAGVPVLDGESEIDRQMRQMTYLNLTGYLRIILDRKDRIGMAAALEGRVPFTDHRLVEYVFNVPWSMKSFDGREKSLLRAAVRDLLPPSVLYRQKAGYPPTDDPRYAEVLREQTAALIRDDSAPIQPYLDLDTARSYLTDPGGPAGDVVNRFSMEMVLYLNEWLDRYQVRVLT